ncbi:MAG: hypothetical protein QOD59_230 [Mycobacterium sp.]|nr:hypothetical protein [Mycobacterium sp.]
MELVALELDDITETPDGLEVCRASKTDQDARGVVVAMPRPGASTPTPTPCACCGPGGRCSPSTASPPVGCCDRPPATTGSAPADAVADLVCDAKVRAELPHADTYSAHSLRARDTTAPYRAGAPVSTISRTAAGRRARWWCCPPCARWTSGKITRWQASGCDSASNVWELQDSEWFAG